LSDSEYSLSGAHPDRDSESTLVASIVPMLLSLNETLLRIFINRPPKSVA
jgi:hypothetical protein